MLLVLLISSILACPPLIEKYYVVDNIEHIATAIKIHQLGANIIFLADDHYDLAEHLDIFLDENERFTGTFYILYKKDITEEIRYRLNDKRILNPDLRSSIEPFKNQTNFHFYGCKNLKYINIFKELGANIVYVNDSNPMSEITKLTNRDCLTRLFRHIGRFEMYYMSRDISSLFRRR